jgi:glycosyltransferase involved in cell wall biosynthesis
VVIPVFNEETWAPRSVNAVLSSAAAAGWPVEVVVVDDGSTDGTAAALARLVAESGVSVVTQANRGRFAARRAGLDRATGDRVLFVDSRVVVRPDALAWLANQLADHPDRRVWNGHVHVVDDGNPYNGFWAGLVAVVWRRYLRSPRLMSFDAADFDAFPKGAGFFCAPRALLLEATDAFRSLYSDDRMASDDTKLIRWVAERERIWISPELACDYHGRSTLPGFLRHAFFRGATFVDGYLVAPGAMRRSAALGAAAVVGVGAIASRRPHQAAVLAVAAPVAAGVLTRACGASQAQARSVSLLLPAFVPAFGAGALRGLLLAGREHRRRRGGR